MPQIPDRSDQNINRHNQNRKGSVHRLFPAASLSAVKRPPAGIFYINAVSIDMYLIPIRFYMYAFTQADMHRFFFIFHMDAIEADVDTLFSGFFCLTIALDQRIQRNFIKRGQRNQIIGIGRGFSSFP